MSLKEQIERELGVPVKLRAGAPGALDVFVDSDKVYSKKQTGRMPSAGELIGVIRARDRA